MLALRLARGSHPLVLLRRLFVVAASAGTGFLLLAALGHATAHPDAATASLARLMWCAVPLAATAQLSASVARADPAARLRRGMAAVGLGSVRLTLLAATSTALSCLLGSLLAALAFLHLRGHFHRGPLSGSAAGLLGAGHPLPPAGTLLLLCVVPLSAAVVTAVALRPRKHIPPFTDTTAVTHTTASRTTAPGPAAPGPTSHGATSREATGGPTLPAGLPWGIALAAMGLALEAHTGRGSAGPGGLLPLPGRLTDSPPGVLLGWALSALGLVLAGPGLAHVCGRLLCACRPGAVRLLAGRALQEEARRIGRPLGALCVVASGTYAAIRVYETSGARPFGPLTALAMALVLACAGISVLTAAVETRSARAHTTAALRRLGTPLSFLHRVTALRATALLLVLTPLTWALAELAALPVLR
ncbi:hypothetical protein [Streptomyces sp. MST-110588]|uniref:hypothetical protein n=1 Tax=Streptomyces sp. MST-110588 TaxID=2833628 RepID=UPI001F5E2DB1|nr:hypothetical protein [Streptomyces sp. MST-110588]UNO39688.1 hypothetical protein KGS77_08855 [Streptomyces sp. MST-110588]